MDGRLAKLGDTCRKLMHCSVRNDGVQCREGGMEVDVLSRMGEIGRGEESLSILMGN